MGEGEGLEERGRIKGESVYDCKKEKESWRNNFSMRRGKNLA